MTTALAFVGGTIFGAIIGMLVIAVLAAGHDDRD